MSPITLFWHRRDLRLHDNAGLYRALAESGHPVLPVFIFDTDILDKLEDKGDARVQFIHDELQVLRRELEKLGSSMVVRHGKPLEIWQELLEEYRVAAVYTNRDYEPYAKERDAQVAGLLARQSIPFHTHKDHVVFEGLEVAKKDGTPYTVFTPYSRQWRAKWDACALESKEAEDQRQPVPCDLKPYPNADYFGNFLPIRPFPMPSLADLGFAESKLPIPPREVRQGIIREYGRTRDFPAQDGTSRLGIHFRFGTISIRQKALRASRLNATYLNELIWRDFYAMILDNFPYVARAPFREKYAHIQWRDNEADFQAWCEGRTGYPIVDAGMRELNATGYMHNRVRMITASFLTKHLLLHWQWGAAYFAKKLLDFDLASNNGGWQWAAGCGTDAAPYFRIFNPYSQQEKFDKGFEYIKKWVPEYGTDAYPQPIVEHKAARERCLRVFKEGLERK